MLSIFIHFVSLIEHHNPVRVIYIKQVKEEDKSNSDDVQTSANDCIEEEAMNILHIGNPIDYIMDQFSAIHIGDEVIGEILALAFACQSCSNSEGIHLDCSGPSGKGKTDACKAMGFLLPQDYYVSGSLSNKVLFHMNLKTGSAILLDDTDSFTEDMEQLLKSTISNYQEGFTHRYTDLKMQGDVKVREISIPPRTVFILTSVFSSFDDQVLNRFVKANVDESQAHHDQVVDQILDNAVSGDYTFTNTKGVKVCREMFRQLKENSPRPVSIPFAKRIKWNYSESFRNIKMFLDLIRGSAIFCQHQRACEDGQIIATFTDFERAKRLWSKIHRAQTTGLTGEEQKVFDAIVSAKVTGISNKDLEKKTGLVKGSISRAIHGKKQSGSGEHKGGLKNKVIGLSYDSFAKVWIYDGVVKNQDDIVMLMDAPKEEDKESGCIQLHAVATPMQPIFIDVK